MKCSVGLENKSPKNKICSKCKKEAVIYLPYSNSYLCKNHFFDLVEKRFKRTNREFTYIKKGDKVAVGLSGGKDSVVMLYLLDKLRKNFPFELIAITIDHGIHCDYWEKTIAIAKKYAKKMNVEHYIFSYEEELGFTLNQLVDRLKIKNPCSYCGVFRKYLLNKKSRELGASKLAIGHNLDDMTQTVFLNLMRNEPLRFVRFNDHLIDNKSFVPRIKPLIRIPEEEIVEYGKLKKMGLEDKKCCPYSSYALRNVARELVNELERKQPGARMKIFNSFLSIQKLMKKGLGKHEFKMNKCVRCGEPSSGDLCMCCKKVSEFEENKKKRKSKVKK